MTKAMRIFGGDGKKPSLPYSPLFHKLLEQILEVKEYGSR
jgi:hypothetical protein